MKIYGYADDALAIEDLAPVQLTEVTLVATPDELRSIARFFEACAREMEVHGTSWEHEHLSDRDRAFEASPNLVVFNSALADSF